jgi:hypothetical protein
LGFKQQGCGFRLRLRVWGLRFRASGEDNLEVAVGNRLGNVLRILDFPHLHETRVVRHLHIGTPFRPRRRVWG